MDEHHLLAAARYVEMNPVAAGLVENPIDYRWSSAHAHLEREPDGLTKIEPLLGMVDDWRSFLSLLSSDDLDLLQRHERTGRPLGTTVFIESLERKFGRSLRPLKPGPKKPNILD
jgi:putative transposase